MTAGAALLQHNARAQRSNPPTAPPRLDCLCSSSLHQRVREEVAKVCERDEANHRGGPGGGGVLSRLDRSASACLNK